MLDYYAHTQDERFARDVMVPFADAFPFLEKHKPPQSERTSWKRGLAP
jgi:hypothetical protein